MGAETTNAGLVQNAITLEPGDVMNQSAVDATRRNLYDIGSFRRVDFDFGDAATTPDAGELPLTLTIQTEEPQRFQLKYGVQFSFDQSAGKSSGPRWVGRWSCGTVTSSAEPSKPASAPTGTRTCRHSGSSFLRLACSANTYARMYTCASAVSRTLSTVDSSLDGVTLDDRRRDLTIEQRWRPAAPSSSSGDTTSRHAGFC